MNREAQRATRRKKDSSAQPVAKGSTTSAPQPLAPVKNVDAVTIKIERVWRHSCGLLCVNFDDKRPPKSCYDTNCTEEGFTLHEEKPWKQGTVADLGRTTYIW